MDEACQDQGKDYILCLANILEAIQDAHTDAQSYRSHCLKFNTAAQRLRGNVSEILTIDPSFGTTDEAKASLHGVYTTLEDGLSCIRKCANLTGISKFLDHGGLKARLEHLSSTLDQEVIKANAFMKNYIARCKSLKKAERIQNLRRGVTKVAPAN